MYEFVELHKLLCILIFIIYLSQEGYWDCELAIKFGYPKGKLFKLLQRKLMLGYVANRVDRIAETLNQLEEMLAADKTTATKNFNCKNELLIFCFLSINFGIHFAVGSEMQKFEEYKRQREAQKSLPSPKDPKAIDAELRHKKLIQ